MANRRNNTAFVTKRLTICAILSALAVVILCLGAIIEIMDISLAMVASFITLLIFWSYGKSYALMSFAVTSILSLVFMPQSFAPWTYLGLFGYYPMIKNALDKLPKFPRWLLKILLMTLVLAVYMLIIYMTTMSGSGTLQNVLEKCFGEPGEPAWMGWTVLGLSYFVFICYDVLIDKLLIIYRYKWQTRIERWMK